MKIIIKILGKITEQEALEKVYSVVSGGRKSEHKNGDHFCWVTKFNDGFTVSVRTKRTKKSADSFVVYKHKK